MKTTFNMILQSTTELLSAHQQNIIGSEALFPSKLVCECGYWQKQYNFQNAMKTVQLKKQFWK